MDEQQWIVITLFLGGALVFIWAVYGLMTGISPSYSAFNIGAGLIIADSAYMFVKHPLNHKMYGYVALTVISLLFIVIYVSTIVAAINPSQAQYLPVGIYTLLNLGILLSFVGAVMLIMYKRTDK
jgi:hypothetical protein